MFENSKHVAIATVFLMTSTLVILPGQESGETSVENPDPNAGFFAYSGGEVRAKRARTRTTGQIFAVNAQWRDLAGATLSYTIPSGTRDLFNVAFSAECRLNNALGNDYVAIRIADTYQGNTTFLEPNDNAVVFCSADKWALQKGNWVKIAGAGLHSLQVQFRVTNAFPFVPAPNASIDDWAFELVVYN